MSEIRNEIIAHISNDPNNAADAFIRLQGEFKQLEKDKALLLEALKNAVIDISSWGSYASDYFQEKHGLEKDIMEYQAIIKQCGSEV